MPCSASPMTIKRESVAWRTRSIAERKRPGPLLRLPTSWPTCVLRNDMGKRRKAREAAIQYHFWRDLQRGEGPERIDDFWEFCPGAPRVREFAQPLIQGMVEHLPEIDERIR